MKDWRILSVGAWFSFTLSLSVWQGIFARKILTQLSSLSPAEASLLARHARMVQAESFTIGSMLLIGGIALTILIGRERRNAARLREFFATFTHELKTSLASLRLQAEVLEDSLSQMGAGRRADRILSDLTRIDLQLENSLGLAREQDEAFFIERVSLKDTLSSLQHSFSLPIHLSRDCELQVDKRAFESILKNITQNASLHGNAQNLFVDVQAGSTSSRVKIKFLDDGEGARAQADQLGRLFHRPTSTSKNGIGLYLVRKFAEGMGGIANFNPKSSKGFEVSLELNGRLL